MFVYEVHFSQHAHRQLKLALSAKSVGLQCALECHWASLMTDLTNLVKVPYPYIVDSRYQPARVHVTKARFAYMQSPYRLEVLNYMV